MLKRIPCFVHDLKFVLLLWRPMFKPFLTSITHVDQWVKIPFLLNEYWTINHLFDLTRKIGRLVKLDSFTLQNVEKAQIARVCLCINIATPIPPVPFL